MDFSASAHNAASQLAAVQDMARRKVQSEAERDNAVLETADALRQLNIRLDQERAERALFEERTRIERLAAEHRDEVARIAAVAKADRESLRNRRFQWVNIALVALTLFATIVIGLLTLSSNNISGTNSTMPIATATAN